VPQQISGLTTGNLLARTRALEAFRVPAKFELVNDITLPVVSGVGGHMLIARDMNQMRLIDAAAWVYTVSPSDQIEVMIEDDIYGDLLNSPIVIGAGSTSSLPSVADIIQSQPLPMGDRIYTDVVNPGADAFGLGVVLIYG
jgi:hypothetical protein